MGVREVTATWEMLVQFKEAVLNVEWPGQYVRAVAMGLELIKGMEIQYRAQIEMLKAQEKQQAQDAKKNIEAMGGKINGQA